MPFLPIELGPNFKKTISADDIGRGFKQNVASSEDALKKPVFISEPFVREEPFNTSYSKSYILDSLDSVTDSMGIKGELGKFFEFHLREHICSNSILHSPFSMNNVNRGEQVSRTDR